MASHQTSLLSIGAIFALALMPACDSSERPASPGPATGAVTTAAGKTGGAMYAAPGRAEAPEPPTPAIPPGPPRAGARAPDVVLITLDALRADHLPCYGYARDTAPALTALSRQALVFTHAFAHSSETQTSVPALLTGQFPSGPAWEEIPAQSGIAERLKAAGYRTGAFLGNAWLAPARGYQQGVDRFVFVDYFYPPPSLPGKKTRPRVDGAVLVRSALEFLEQSDRPTFVWLHLMDVHNPYRAPAPFAGMFPSAGGRDRYVNGPAPAGTTPADIAYMNDRYDEGIRYTDMLLEPLFQALDTPKRRARTLLIVTADHGEELGDHGGLGHGTSLYLEQLRVPLLVRLPGTARGDAAIGKGASIDRAVALWDIVPTALAAVGIPPDPALPGHDLRGFAETSAAAASRLGGPDDRLLPAAVRSLETGRLLFSAIQGRDHLILAPEAGERHHFDWPADPGERQNLLSPGTPRTTALEAALNDSPVMRGARRPAADLAPGRREQLEALGYVGRP